MKESGSIASLRKWLGIYHEWIRLQIFTLGRNYVKFLSNLTMTMQLGRNGEPTEHFLKYGIAWSVKRSSIQPLFGRMFGTEEKQRG